MKLTFEFGNQRFTAEIAHESIWLIVGGVSTPLAMQYDSQGRRYAYLTSGNKTSYKEVRIYSNGEVYY